MRTKVEASPPATASLALGAGDLQPREGPRYTLEPVEAPMDELDLLPATGIDRHPERVQGLQERSPAPAGAPLPMDLLAVSDGLTNLGYLVILEEPLGTFNVVRGDEVQMERVTENEPPPVSPTEHASSQRKYVVGRVSPITPGSPSLDPFRNGHLEGDHLVHCDLRQLQLANYRAEMVLEQVGVVLQGPWAGVQVTVPSEERQVGSPQVLNAHLTTFAKARLCFLVFQGANLLPNGGPEEVDLFDSHVRLQDGYFHPAPPPVCPGADLNLGTEDTQRDPLHGVTPFLINEVGGASRQLGVRSADYLYSDAGYVSHGKVLPGLVPRPCGLYAGCTRSTREIGPNKGNWVGRSLT